MEIFWFAAMGDRYVWLANGKDMDLFRGQMPSNVMSGFIKPQLFGEIPCAKEAGFALLEGLAQGSKLLQARVRVMEWLGLEETLKISQFQLPCLGQGHLPLDQNAPFNLAFNNFGMEHPQHLWATSSRLPPPSQ